MRRVARLEQVLARVGAHRPVVVLAGPVHARKRLLVQQAHQAVAARDVPHHLHRQLLVIGADVRVLEHRGELVLVGRDLVVTGLDRHPELAELALGIQHAGQDPLRDRAEVVIVELVALRRLGPEQRPPRGHQVGPLEVVLLVDQEVLLLRADGREHPPRARVAEQPQRVHGRLGQRVHRAQQRDLVVERLPRPRCERGRNAEQRPVGVLENERRAGRIPRRVAAGLERGPDAAGRERGRVGLALDQLLARELGQRRALAGRAVEAVVLLGRGAGQRLEPVRVVRGAVLERPLLHRQRHRIGERGVQSLSAREGLLQPAEHVLGESLALNRRTEDVGTEDLIVRRRQVRRPQRAPVGRPLCGHDVLLADSRHASCRSFLCEARRRGRTGSYPVSDVKPAM